MGQQTFFSGKRAEYALVLTFTSYSTGPGVIRFGLWPLFVNKILFIHSCVHSFTYVYGFFHVTTAELSSYERVNGLQSLRHLLSIFPQKKPCGSLRLNYECLEGKIQWFSSLYNNPYCSLDACYVPITVTVLIILNPEQLYEVICSILVL